MYARNAYNAWQLDTADSSTVNYLPAGTGAVATDVQSKLRDIVSIDDFDTLQDAVNTGAAVFIPRGDRLIDSEVNIGLAGTRVYGSGITSTRLMQTALDRKIFNITADDVVVCGMSLDYDGIPQSGATAIHCEGANAEFHSFKINRCHQGVKMVGAIIGSIHDFKIYNFVSAGLYIEDSADIYIRSFLIDAINPTNGALGNIFLNKFCEALIFSDGDVLNGVYSLFTAADVDTQGQAPAHNAFSGVYFDGSVSGCYLDKAYITEFVNCWFSAGRSGAGNPGATLVKTDGLAFTNCRFVDCGSHGALISSSAERTTFMNCKFFGNSQTAGANVASGLYISPSTNNVTVIGCAARNTYFVGTQKYGIEIGNICTNVICSSNSVTGNGTGGLLVGSSLVNSRIMDNIGYNPVGGSAITVGASPYTYTAGPSPETVYISSGTVSGIFTQGAAIFSNTDKTVQLGPNESLQVAYSVIPYMNKVVH